jgi:hypothetical protein
MSRRDRNLQGSVSDVISSEQVADVTTDVATETVTGPKSIRQLIMGSILAGKPTKEIAEAVKAAFPNSAAAAKSTKHIAWYRSRMKKDGQLPVKQAPEVTA